MENQVELKWYKKPNGVIILLILFFPVGLYLMWKNELWTKQTRWIVTVVLAVIVIASAGNDKSSSISNDNSSSSTSSSSEDTSKEAYRRGYADGQTGYGLPASERGSAYEYHMAYGYNYSSEDYALYEMGYNDGVYGRTKKY
jgi:hypothetical protein